MESRVQATKDRYIKRISFHLMTPDQIRKLSVKLITQPTIFDNLNHPVKGGLYDPALGPIDKNAKCVTCELNFFQCYGHFGHIELSVPVYNPLAFGHMFLVLRQMCTHCHRFRTGKMRTAITKGKLRLLDAGLLMQAIELDALAEQFHELYGALDADALIDKLEKHIQSLLSDSNTKCFFKQKSAIIAETRSKVANEFFMRGSTSPICQHCKKHIPALHRHENIKIFQKPLKKTASFNVSIGARNEEDNMAETITAEAIKGMQYMTPMHIYILLKKLWANEKALLELMFGGPMRSRKDTVDHRIFFTEVIAVPPNRFRPPNSFGDSQFDHPQNIWLLEIIRRDRRIVELRRKKNRDKDQTKQEITENFTGIIQTWTLLQEQVNYFFDSARAPATRGKVPPAGIRQLLEKKEGLFRKHMMGKRVNYAARSVISPDPNLETSEIGVPMVFAKKLTYPESVTLFNISQLCQAVINGPETYPGASHVQMADGSLTSLEFMGVEKRKALAKELLRQPGKRVHRHIRNGDIVLMNRQPTLHKPSIMAHRVRVLPGEKTLRMHYANCDTYNADFDGDEMNLHVPQSELARAEAYTVANTDNQYLVPTDGSPLRGLIQDHIVTGVLLTLKDTFLTREVFQQLLFGSLPNLRIKMISPAVWKPRVLWTGKQLITAVLLNLAAGREPITLKSSCKIPAKVWSKSHVEEAQVNIQKGYLLTGIMDKSQFGASEYGVTHAVYELYGPETAGDLLTTLGRILTKFDQFYGFSCRIDDLLLISSADNSRRQLIESSHKIGRQVLASYADVDSGDFSALRAELERITRNDDRSHGLDHAMKAKMNELTSKIIDVCLSEGQYVRFPFNNMSLMTLSGAKGSMVNFSQISGCLGQQELEGRRVPVMVSGKTLPSFPAWDMRPRAGGYITQRFLTGIRPQEFFFHCMAGREGLIDTAVKTSRSGYLQRCLIKHLESVRVHYDNTVRGCDGSILQFYYGEDGLDVTKQKYLKRFDFIANNYHAVRNQCQPLSVLDRIDAERALKPAKKAWKKPHSYDPVLANYQPSVYLGATSEMFYADLEKYIAEDFELKNIIGVSKFRALLWLKYMRSLVEPGEAVGLLAAQSIGEPSTQMTLNTFHFAGFGAKNVTLGIPRLREVIMTASKKIKTPSMTLFVKEEHFDKTNLLCRKLSKLTLKNILSEISVTETLTSSYGAVAINSGKRVRVDTVELQFLPFSQIAEQYSCKSSTVKSILENSFVSRLLNAIEKCLKRAIQKKDLVITMAKAEQPPLNLDEEEPHQNRKQDNDDNDDDDYDDQIEKDEENVKQINKKNLSYEIDEEEDNNEHELEHEPKQDENYIHEDAEDCAANTTLSECRSIRNYKFHRQSSMAVFDLVFPSSEQKLLLLDVLEKVCEETIVSQIPGIARCFTQYSEGRDQKLDPDQIVSEGVNINGLWEYADYIDLNRIYSNDIHFVLTIYGVEAARSVIVKEIAAVFAVYGISVDARHLFVIADYMTADGKYRAFNRIGIDSSSSPLLKMTFETTVNFLRKAALQGDFDDLQSPASRLVMGQPVAVGTGMCDLLQK